MKPAKYRVRQTGEFCRDEKLLDRLPAGNWIGGTIPILSERPAAFLQRKTVCHHTSGFSQA